MAKRLTLDELIEAGHALDTRTGSLDTICPVSESGYHDWTDWIETETEERYTCGDCGLKIYETRTGILFRQLTPRG